MPFQPGIDVAGRRVDEQAESAQELLPLEPRDEIVGQLDPFERLAEHEFARVQDERLLVLDRDELGQVRLRRPDVDVRVAVVAEDPEAAVEVQVDRRRLQVRRVVRADDDPPGLELGPDVAVGEDAHASRAPGVPRSSYRLSTSRLSASRSSKLW